MKNLLIVFFLILLTTKIYYLKENNCQGMKKLSKAFLTCKAGSIKKGTVEKAGNLKDSVKKLGSGFVKPFKKKD